MNKPYKPEAAETAQTTNVPAVDLPILVRRFYPCDHPDHNADNDCQDRAVGCSKHCECCMGEDAIALPCDD